MTAPVIGQTSTPRLTAYISVDMFKNNGRRGVSVDQLVPKGRAADQDAALEQYIESASAWIDSFCQQIQVATYDTQVRRVNVNRKGFVEIHTRYTPIIAVTAVSLGSTPALMTALSSLAGVGIEPSSFYVPATTGNLPANTPQGPIQFGNSGIGQQDQAWAKFTYVNGYPVTTLTQPATVGDVVLNVLDTTGVVNGNTWLTVFAGAKRFHFLAGAVSTAGVNGIGTGPGTVACPAVPLSIPIAGPTATLVSALPQDFIDAAVIVTRAMIKEMVPAASAGKDSPSSGDDLIEAAGMLRAYVAPVV